MGAGTRLGRESVAGGAGAAEADDMARSNKVGHVLLGRGVGDTGQELILASSKRGLAREGSQQVGVAPLETPRAGRVCRGR